MCFTADLKSSSAGFIFSITGKCSLSPRSSLSSASLLQYPPPSHLFHSLFPSLNAFSCPLSIHLPSISVTHTPTRTHTLHTSLTSSLLFCSTMFVSKQMTTFCSSTPSFHLFLSIPLFSRSSSRSHSGSGFKNLIPVEVTYVLFVCVAKGSRGKVPR